MEQALIHRLAHLLGSTPTHWRAITERGFTNNQRVAVQLANGSSVFIKRAVNEQTTAWLRAEYLVYSELEAEFMPRLIAWDEEDEFPVLAIEDLSDAAWPPPWSVSAVAAVRKTLDELAALPVPPVLKEKLPTLTTRAMSRPNWPDVAEDPDRFLKFGLCSAAWLERHLDILIAATDATELEGDALCHCDIRSDNLCLRDGRAVLFDWNWARIGNPIIDLGGWLPSLHEEGGPAPETLLPDGAGNVASFMSGYYASQAGLPRIPEAPRVRDIQLAQLRPAFLWTIKALGLPMPVELEKEQS